MAGLYFLLLLCMSMNVTCIDFTMSRPRVVLGDTGTLAMKCSLTERDAIRVYMLKIKRVVSPKSNTDELLATFDSGVFAILNSGITNNRDFAVTGSLNDSPPYLQLVMNISKLTCSDARMYTCEAAYESSTTGQIETPEKNVTLQAFVLPTMTSLVGKKNDAYVAGGSLSDKAAFDVGDVLELSCKANIGSLDSTKIKWRKTAETGSGFTAYDPPAGTFTDGTAVSDNQCGYDRTATIRYYTTASDPWYDLAFECYVSVSGYPSSPSIPLGVYTTTNNLQYHLNVSRTPMQDICWDSHWYNESAPTAVNRSEYEQPSAHILDSICTNGHVIAARCKDDKGESFSGFRNDTVSTYIAVCNVIGLICIPYKPYKYSGWGCPDFQISYGCPCLTTATTTKTSRPIAATAMNMTTSSTTSSTWPTTAETALSTNSTDTQLEDVIEVMCTESNWNITVDMNLLRLLYPSIKTNDLYFGQSKCQGRVEGSSLLFQQGLHSCSTKEQAESDRDIFKNNLYYVMFDPLYPFVVRQHKWTFAVECDVMRNEETSSHVEHNEETHNATFINHRPVSMAFYSDLNFENQISNGPLQVHLGDNVFVKVYTSLADWDTKMRLDTCYTAPSGSSTRNMDLILIRDGCEIDKNTHIISQSTHETRFLYKDFKYFNNGRGLDIHCNATFCHSSDFSAQCSQTCHSAHIPEPDVA